MVTRLLLQREAVHPGTPSFTPAGGWEKTTGANLGLRANKSGYIPGIGLATTTLAAQGTSGNDTLLNQWVSSPLDSDQTISGTVKSYARASESAAGLDGRTQLVIRVIAPDGTVRGTLLDFNADALSSEFATSLTNRRYPLNSGSNTLTSVNALTGDRIVMEYGARQHATAAGNFSMSIGDAATDCAENETATTANAPWIEFSQTITFTDDNQLRSTQVSLEVLYEGTPALRSTQVSLEALVEQLAYSTGGNSTTDTVGPVTITMSSAVAVGDLIILAVANDGTATQSWSHTQGFSDLLDLSSGGAMRLVIKYIKVGASFDTTLDITLSAAERISWSWIKIDAADWTGDVADIEITSSSGTSTAPDPPSLNPTWGALPTMYMAVISHDDSNDSISLGPADYQRQTEWTQGGTGANVGTEVYLKRSSATSDDPGAGTLSASEEWACATIGILISGVSVGVTSYIDTVWIG